jgi:hypothetical protein
MFTCEVHTHACIFLNIFLLRHTQFLKHTPESDFYKQSVVLTRRTVILTRRRLTSHEESDFDTLQCDFHTHECYFYTYESDFHIKSVIFTNRVQFPHTKCDFETHEFNFYTHESDVECDYDNHQPKLK